MKIAEVHRTMNREEILSSFDGFIFDPQYVIDEEHVIFAYIHMKKALKKGTTIANDPKVEFLVRLSAETQIAKAMELGIKNEMKKIGILLPEEEGISSIVGDKEKIKNFFGTADKRAIFEKIAVMDIL
jgi:tRNA threonylcarbamoyladenosine modification (KEOPS) complex Cgi121 subunit